MKITSSSKEGFLRSVGHPPNGIIAISTPNDSFAWAVDPRTDPAIAAPGLREGVVEIFAEGGVTEGTTLLDIDEFVAALDPTEDVLAVVLKTVETFCVQVATIHSRHGRYEWLITAAEFAIETRSALVERFGNPIGSRGLNG